MRRLVVVEGNAEPAEVPVEASVLIGRGLDADLRLLDETASRQHARVERDGTDIRLEDLESANGTALNGERIRGTVSLYVGDEIRIGGVRLRLEGDGGVDRPTVVAAEDPEHVAASVDPERADPAADGRGEAAVRRLRLVCDGATACADAARPDEVPEALLSLIVEALAPDRAAIVLLDTGGAPRVAAAHPPGARAPDSRTLRVRVLDAGEAVLVDPGVARPGPASGASLVASRFQCTLAAPLSTAEGVLGLVVVEAETSGRYGTEDLQALAAAARQAALALRNLRALSTARTQVRALRERREIGAPPLLGEAEAMQAVRNDIARAAAVDSPVLVTGETGTGKELAARRLHAEGPRRRAPFVALNCAALVEGLLESELFGHEKGAFTGANESRDGRIAQAARGTLFLDEVGDLPLQLQSKLLRVLSEGTYTRVGGRRVRTMACRVLAATNQDLEAMVAEKTFRQDLYFRLAVLEIRLPPLRERGRDVEVLAEAGLERLAARLARPVPRLAADARDALRNYVWPGNVRELFNVLERALVLAEGDTITARDLPSDVREGRRGSAEDDPATGPVLTMREAEARAVRAALEATGGRKGKAAALLGISWPTLNRKIREYGLDVPRPDAEAD